MSNSNRRQFIEGSLVAAAAAVAPSSDALASPSEKLGVAVIGARGRGNSHLSFLARRHDVEVLYVCDVDRRVGQRRVQQLQRAGRGRHAAWVADLRRVLDDPRVNVVTIATPNHWHALAAIWSMQAGKDVYVEVPVSHNVWEGQRMVEAARRYQRVCQAGLQARSHPGALAAISFLRAGHLGHVRLARVVGFRPRRHLGVRKQYSIPDHVDYPLWLGPAPATPLTRPRVHFDWRWQWDYGNGDVGHHAIHQLDVARWGLGARWPQTTIAFGGQFRAPDIAETPDTQVIMHEYQGQSLVVESRSLPSETVSLVSRGIPHEHCPTVGVVFEGERGYLVMNNLHSGDAYNWQGELLQKFRGARGHDFHFRNFLRAVRSRRLLELRADIEEGHLTSALCHLGNLSMRLGQRAPSEEVLGNLLDCKSADSVIDLHVRTSDHLREHGGKTWVMGRSLLIDPETEMISDPSAAKLLKRHYRQPFAVPDIV